MPSDLTARLDVHVSSGSYPIFLGRDLRVSLEAYLESLRKDGSKFAAVADRAARAALAERFGFLFDAMPTLEIPSGETSKGMEQYARIIGFFADCQLDRNGVAIAFGGGVTGDLAGFAAATYLRGIRLIQAPTTLLAMVDSSVGGKTGINIEAGKNLVGAFHQPLAVFADMESLSTLPAREFSAGMAEAIKTGLLADASLFELIEKKPLSDWTDARLPDVVGRCCEIKADVVRADERETAATGGRALLNLGHTFAHAIERVAGYGRYLHGEAVAIGLAAAARLSHRLGRIAPSDVERVDAALVAHRLPSRLERPLPLAELMLAMGRDKKIRSGRLRFVVMERIGKAATESQAPVAEVEAVWRALGAA